MRFVSTVAVILAMALASAAESKPAAWQYRWQVWLPSNWVSVARCETGLNFGHANSSFVSAFGIQRGSHNGAYDSDARKVGMPRWNDSNPPTPWQQWRTALSHYARFGDGWGCPGP